jgi:flagellar hook-associated protein 2
MGLSVSGLVSGLDVPTIVSQLMQSESIPQQQLQLQLSTVQNQASTYRAINTKFSTLLSAAQAMTSSSTWNATSATSSTSSVAVAATSTAQAGSVSFTVDHTAAAQSVITNLATPWKATTDAYGLAVPVTVTDASGKSLGDVKPTGTGTGGAVTLGDVITAINGTSALGLNAAAVQVSPGNYQLQITAKSTGLANKFSLSDTTDFTTVSAAQDAQISVGTTSPYTVTSSTNTFTGFMPGVTLTVSQKEPNPVTVSVAANPQSVGDKMQALVNAANAALSEIGTDTDTGMGSDNSSGKAGVLAGDYGMQSMASKVLSIVSGSVGKLGSPVQIGLELNSDGTIKFDESTFVSALKTNPTLVQQFVSGIPAQPAVGTTPATAAVPGIAAQLVTMATAATDKVTGTLVALANGEDSQAKNLQSQIDDWTVRLTARQQALTTQYTDLQTMLSSLQNQQSWLSSMFDTATSSSSSSSSSS